VPLAISQAANAAATSANHDNEKVKQVTSTDVVVHAPGLEIQSRDDVTSLESAE